MQITCLTKVLYLENIKNLKTLNSKEMQIKTVMSYHCTQIRTAKIKNTAVTTPNSGEDAVFIMAVAVTLEEFGSFLKG